jgi:hypothetical protein
MITGISIENFKGIRERVQLDFRPITLLFGANSAGKSTVLHALHYAREVFERHNLDADQTITGGEYVDLGGFKQFVHQHISPDETQAATEITIRIDLNLQGEDLPDHEPEYHHCGEFLGMHLNSLIFWPSDGVAAAIELCIAWSRLEERAFVKRLAFEIGNEEFATIETSSNLKEVFLRPNLQHEILLRVEEWNEADEDFTGSHDRDKPSVLEKLMDHCGDIISPGDGKRYDLSGHGDSLPPLDEPLAFVYEQLDVAPVPPTATKEMSQQYEQAAEDLRNKRAIANEITNGVGELVLGACRIVREQLRRFRYLGPLRETPPREFKPPRFPDPSRWSSGLGAWDALQNGSEQLVDEVGDWLSGVNNLNAGCHIERRTYLELDYGNPMVRALMARRAFDDHDEQIGTQLAKAPTSSRVVIVPHNSGIELRPHDVGIGISQVVPVIVTALDDQERILAIEQPELHIHPRLQAAIADLFIEAIHKNKHRFIIETHSEHLVLRLLRRIRETEQGQAPPNRELRTHDLAIYFLQQDQGATRAQRIDVDVKGEFIQPWPDDFFEIDFQERFA